MHGVAVPDGYRWLEDQQAAETRAWIAAQNRFREERMAGLPVAKTVDDTTLRLQFVMWQLGMLR